MEQEIMRKAEVLIEALPYIQKFNRKIVVVKYGGSAMLDEQLKENVIKDVVLLKLVGFKPIIVHGGGKDISKWVSKAGMEPKFINGLRVTDAPTMEIAEMVLNRVNKSLVQMVEKLGVHAVGISGYDDNYDSYNINADDAACAIASAVHAEKLAFLTDTEGVFRVFEDKDSFIPTMTVTEAEEFVASGAATGGMLPKLTNCIQALKDGVSRVHILDGRIAHCLLLEIFTNRGIGTAITSDHSAEEHHE